MWAPGQIIGDYELIANLRSGGMATLFMARRRGAAGFSKPVAIKLIHPELASDPQFHQMFLDEARISARIQHPNVVHVEAFGEHQGLHYLVMELVHGCSLAQLIRALIQRGRRLSPSFAVRIAMHVADALHGAHQTRDEQGRLLDIVHRDVSPENILLAYAGHVKLIDFGIAKAVGRRQDTQEGLLKGKFRYMAPEQALGKKVDARTDIYQLGIVLWEMLTNRPLFDAPDDLEVLREVRDPKVSPPGQLVNRIPPALDATVMAALAKNPARRPQDALTFARALAKTTPGVHDVDSGALSSLLLATMTDHRQQQKATYPPAEFDRLEQQIDTLRMGGAHGAAQVDANARFTVEHTEPYGSMAPPSPHDARAAHHAPHGPQTEPGYASPGQGASQRVHVAGNVIHRQEPRQRRLVRLASEIRTTITAIEQRLGKRQLMWFAIGAALALSLGLALVTSLIRHSRHSRVSPPAPPVAVAPPAPPQLAAPVPPPPVVAQSAREDASGAESAPDAAAPSVTRKAAPPGERTGARKLAPISAVNGAPLILEPGF